MLTQEQLFSLPTGTVLDMDSGDVITIASNVDGRLTLQFTITRESAAGFEELVASVLPPQ